MCNMLLVKYWFFVYIVVFKKSDLLKEKRKIKVYIFIIERYFS